MIESFRSKALKRYWTKGDESALRADWRGKIKRALAALDAAAEPTDLDLPGYRFHALSGDKAGRFAVLISHNWRLTFGWSDGNATDVDLEDYHG